ncbi:RNA polymerase sigma factor [Acanthopleuribacter pedis]|uniref:RNA polymerase sigma factor n=1 Tax=Acanthopleuribacter pedis TaxID=442870 RepID=A0A8J7QCL1_9BACT|nr:RNA polymerase sigma factor [Acanthopleuribacter pedis]MBO1317215.1 RNA polymerase sigma factor [Acanthopleuribacter pedis]MBO1318521.1 RNA polymerase sigma factor [Acanthopleuribacter pedis]
MTREEPPAKGDAGIDTGIDAGSDDHRDALADLARQALAGSSAALEQLMEAVRDPIYGLALRMLLHPQDAEDAAQDIAIRIITHLSQFRGEGSFISWAMRIAANTLINMKKKRRLEQLTFADVGAELESGWDAPPLAGQNPATTHRTELKLLVKEVKIGCSSAMLQCLDRDKRIAYILGEIFEVTSEQGAFILEITPAAFRKRLSRARELLTAFMQQHCGLVVRENRCNCRDRLPVAVSRHHVDPKQLFFANHPRAAVSVRQQLNPTTPVSGAVHQTVREIDAMHKVAAVFRSHPDYRGPEAYMQSVRALMQSGSFRAFEV